MNNFDLRKYLAEGKLLKEDITSKAISVLKNYEGEVEGVEGYIKYLMNTSDDISSSIQAIADDLDRDNDTSDSLRRDLEKLSLDEGKLLKENIDMATILSHDDYYDLYIGNKAEHDAADEEEQFSDEYITDLDPGMYQMIYWDDEGPNSMAFDNKLEYVKDSIAGFWGEDGFIEYFGIEDEVNAAGDNWESVFDKHLEDNLDMYYEELNRLINNSEPDGDSASGVVLLVNGKVVAGEAKEI